MKTNYEPQYTLTEALLKIREIFVEENGRLYTSTLKDIIEYLYVMRYNEYV